MSAAAEATPLLRWSSVRACARKAALEATVPADRDPTDREQRIMFRGRRLGRDYGDWLANTYGEAAVERELKVVWPLGVGHIDLFLVPTATAIEVLSSAHASEPMIRSKLVQLAGYMEHYPRAANGCLIVLDPSDFTETRYPVARDTDAYRDLVAEVSRRIEQLERWRTGGGLPDRACRKPQDAHGMFCRHAVTCFDGWQPDPVDPVGDDGARQAVAAFARAKQEEQTANAVANDKERARKDAERRLADLPWFAGTGEWQVGAYRVKRSRTTRPDTVDLRALELAGVDTGPLRPFVRPGATYVTTRIDVTEAAAAAPVDPDAFGTEAPF